MNSYSSKSNDQPTARPRRRTSRGEPADELPDDDETPTHTTKPRWYDPRKFTYLAQSPLRVTRRNSTARLQRRYRQRR
jgi:hypothetical protein